jgi:hypothetical protein
MLQASGKPRVMAPPVRVEQNQRFLLQQNRFEDKQLRNETLGISRNTSLVGSQYRNALHNMINMSRWETHQSVRHASNHACDQELSSPPPSLQAKCVLVFIDVAQAHPPVRTSTYIYQVANRLFKTFKVPNTDHTYLFIEILLETKQQPDRNVTASSSQTLKKHLWDGNVSLTQAVVTSSSTIDLTSCVLQPAATNSGQRQKRGQHNFLP